MKLAMMLMSISLLKWNWKVNKKALKGLGGNMIRTAKDLMILWKVKAFVQLSSHLIVRFAIDKIQITKIK